MKLGIMQPYFFPYLGHFALIKQVDQWIVFDITQYTPKSWMSRNRILHPSSGTNWVGLELSNSSIHISTSEAKLSSLSVSKNTILGKLSHYKKHAPYARKVFALVEESLSGYESDTPNLVDVNVRALALICNYLKIEFNFKICSDLNIEFPDNMGAGDWALEISSVLNADTYLNPIGGREIFEAEKFRSRGIELNFLNFKSKFYNTKTLEYIENLSILDVLMWNTPEIVNQMLIHGSIVERSW